MLANWEIREMSKCLKEGKKTIPSQKKEARRSIEPFSKNATQILTKITYLCKLSHNLCVCVCVFVSMCSKWKESVFLLTMMWTEKSYNYGKWQLQFKIDAFAPSVLQVLVHKTTNHFLILGVWVIKYYDVQFPFSNDMHESASICTSKLWTELNVRFSSVCLFVCDRFTFLYLLFRFHFCLFGLYVYVYVSPLSSSLSETHHIWHSVANDFKNRPKFSALSL